jgi:hypothetical protein
MPNNALPPFSARNRGDLAPIENDFPDTARIGLVHLVADAVQRDYVPGWIPVARELHRIARAAPKKYDPSVVEDIAAAETDVSRAIMSLPWQRPYDFCERLHNYLARATWIDSDGDSHAEVQIVFQEENLPYEFKDGLVQRRGRRNTVTQVSKAEARMADARLVAARAHFAKAQRYFRDREKPDPENAVKEAVCAVEAAARELFPDGKPSDLEDVVKSITGTESGKLPHTTAKTFIGLYTFRGSGEGAAHGGAAGGVATHRKLPSTFWQ